MGDLHDTYAMTDTRPGFVALGPTLGGSIIPSVAGGSGGPFQVSVTIAFPFIVTRKLDPALFVPLAIVLT